MEEQETKSNCEAPPKKKLNKHNIINCELNDTLACLTWISENKLFYSVWEDSYLYLKDFMSNSKVSQKIPCDNFYSSMAYDSSKMKLYLGDSIDKNIDILDLEKYRITKDILNDNFEELAETIILKIIIKDGLLFGITKDPSYFIIDLRTNKIIQNEKFPFRVLCYNYNENNEILALGVKHKKNFSNVDINLKNFLLNNKKNKLPELVNSIENQIKTDEQFCPKEHIHSIALSKSCKYKAIGTSGKIYLYHFGETSGSWNLESIFRTHFLDFQENEQKTEEYKIHKINFSPTLEPILVSAGSDGIIQFYNVAKSLNSKQVIQSDRKHNINGFLDVGWSPKATWMYYSKGYDMKYGDLIGSDDPRKNLISNKLYFSATKEIFMNDKINVILDKD